MSPTAIVDGAPGAGKTTLIHRFLESNKTRLVRVSRCYAERGSKRWREEYAPDRTGKRVSSACAKELRAWEDAGALSASAIMYDPDVFDAIDLIEGAGEGAEEWDEWLLEVENSGYERVHCSIYVLRPLPAELSLVEKRSRIVDYIPFDDYLKHRGVRLLPDEYVQMVESSTEQLQSQGAKSREGPKERGKMTALTDAEVERLRTLVSEGVPVWSDEPALRPECERLPAAEVVIINLHHKSERAAAEATRGKVRKLYQDWSLRERLGYRTWIPRPGAYIANLLQPGDSGTKSALAQIKRKLRGRY